MWISSNNSLYCSLLWHFFHIKKEKGKKVHWAKRALGVELGVLGVHTCLPWTPLLGTKSHFPFFSFFILLHHTACGILVPWPGFEPGPSAVKAQSPSHWSAREFATICLFTLSYSPRGSTVPGGTAMPGWCVQWTAQAASPVPSSKDPCTTLSSDRDSNLIRTDTTLRFSQQAEKRSESHFNLQIPTRSFQKYYYSFTLLFWAMLCTWDQSHFCKNKRERETETQRKREGEERGEASTSTRPGHRLHAEHQARASTVTLFNLRNPPGGETESQQQSPRSCWPAQPPTPSLSSASTWRGCPRQPCSPDLVNRTLF